MEVFEHVLLLLGMGAPAELLWADAGGWVTGG